MLVQLCFGEKNPRASRGNGCAGRHPPVEEDRTLLPMLLLLCWRLCPRGPANPQNSSTAAADGSAVTGSTVRVDLTLSHSTPMRTLPKTDAALSSASSSVPVARGSASSRVA